MRAGPLANKQVNSGSFPGFRKEACDSQQISKLQDISSPAHQLPDLLPIRLLLLLFLMLPSFSLHSNAVFSQRPKVNAMASTKLQQQIQAGWRMTPAKSSRPGSTGQAARSRAKLDKLRGCRGRGHGTWLCRGRTRVLLHLVIPRE